VLHTALETTRPLIEANRHQLTVQLPAEPIQVHADPLRLAQVFANLLNNAARYTEPGGHLWLTAALIADCGLRIADSSSPSPRPCPARGEGEMSPLIQIK
jgi:signal transduction histidine kinase